MHYPGGKAKTYHQILNLVPPHDVYIEPFLGLGSVLRKKKPSTVEIGIDLDERVIDCPTLRKRGVTLLRADGIQFLADYDFSGNEVVYCDPPYLPSTRKRQKVYRHDLDASAHEDLLKKICSIGALVLVSGYESDMYLDYLNGWNIHKFSAKTHNGVREECLWFNFDAPSALHDYGHLGENFRERQVVKRRLTRLKDRISRLSPPERECIKEWLATSWNRHAT